MKLGFHVRVSHGYAEAVAYAKRVGCNALQFFAGNPKTYAVTPIDEPALTTFRELRRSAGIAPAVIHTSYLINLAADDPKIAKNSLRLLQNDIEAAAVGEVSYVNTHLGSYGSGDRGAGFKRVCSALALALEDIQPGVTLVLENSAGAGQLCGGTLTELGEFVRSLDHPQLGVCLDTAHSWAAGYEINGTDGVERFLNEAEREIGLNRIPMFHFNDTQIPLGGHRDRHWHIGEGNIGFDGFRALLMHPELRDKTAILETPGEEADDVRNMQTVRAILKGAEAKAAR
ncbi:MAG: deoxyribonuclease IV [Vulcanimicrobiaceae bacterium]